MSDGSNREIELRAEDWPALEATLVYLLERVRGRELASVYLSGDQRRGVMILDWRCTVVGGAEVDESELPGMPAPPPRDETGSTPTPTTKPERPSRL